MEETLCQRDQTGLFQRLKSLNIEDTLKVSSQYIRDEEGIRGHDAARPRACPREVGAVFWHPSQRKIFISSDSTSTGSRSGLSHTLSGANRQKRG